MSAPVLELRDVSYSYPGCSRPALEGVSLEIAPGELVVVAGGSGSGKSTLLRVASGLVPHFYGGSFSGIAIVAGMDIRDAKPGALAEAVGTLFQDPETQVVLGTARAELSFGLENRGASAAAIARGIEEAALPLGIAHLLERSTESLSGGELQRVALGAALAARPALLVLDEPTSQLDPVAGDELIGTLRRLNEDADVAIVLSEHRLERCLGLADRVLALEGGRIVLDGTPTEFLQWALERAPELATPGARVLAGLGLVPAPGVKAARHALRAGGIEVGQPSLDSSGSGPEPRPERRAARRGRGPEPVLRFERVWQEIDAGPAILRGVTLSFRAGEKVALMGRNGAGKSTLLRHAAELIRPTRGRVEASGRVALLLQNPSDYLIHDTVSAEASPQALRMAGLDPEELADRHPRDLSGGEKQRLALAIVLDSPQGSAPVVVCLDEPTRGMDRGHKAGLGRLLADLPAAVVVATHDPEFAVSFADRVVLLADGAPIADGPPREILAGGTYFATEVARILGGRGDALTAEEGLAAIRFREREPEAIA